MLVTYLVVLTGTPALRIELLCNANQNSEELTSHDVLNEVDVGDSDSLAGHIKAPLELVENNETGEVESVARLKERLKLAEVGCERLGEMYRTYRLRWLEEMYRTKVLEKYAPHGIDTCSPHQIPWDAPSPVQSEDEGEVE
ncbi:uncharacterized protein F5891DRAFT_1182410 [Suillus fuscotomentosus]|uniref:Uncharacterized protein n=1 Tax=Suillus fuscotomentosus TaxID=1912939 RepID=A0AAD4HRK4_9AGAM|nr:uncharacterized protein F5891DRAFT_1182410 [Suillus fuscotomentosus]KAG1906192.1 hypothetical protein F5891DRAFT_1182410 [Suillus fuscotomentosus]